MLREILAITGKPGLFKIVSHSNKMLLVEELGNKKRFPASSRDKVVSLGDIAMYTYGDDKPLGEILDLVYAHFNGQPVDVKALVKAGTLKEVFAEILPDFDQERVYPTDIKKLFTWYNILIDNGYTKFTEEAPAEAEKGEEAEEVQPTEAQKAHADEVLKEEAEKYQDPSVQQDVLTAADEAQAELAEEA